MLKSTEAKADFIEYLESKGLSRSKTRLTLFDLITNLTDHFEAEELLATIKKKNLDISRATLYRTLALFEEGGFIRKVQFTDRHSHFEVAFGDDHHEHLICSKCSKVIDFHRNSIDTSLNEIAQEHNFKPISHKIEIIGICYECHIHSD